MESPIKRRQLVRGGVDLDLYAAAGKTPNILGEAIGGIGTALGEAYDKAKKKADAIAKEEENEIAKSREETDKRAREEIAPADMSSLSPADINNKKLDFQKRGIPENLGVGMKLPERPYQGNTYTYDMLGEDAKAEFLKKNPGQFAAAEAHANKTIQEAKAYNVKKYGTEDPTKNVTGVNNIVNVKKTKDGEYEAGTAEGKPVVEGSTTFGSQGVINPNLYGKGPSRLKDSPFDRRRVRRQLSQPRQSSLANVFGGPSQTSYLVGNRSVPSDAISRGEVSQYTPGRTFVEKERRLSAPSWMGIGAAAIEGYNMGVEKRNYEKQVQADLADYYSNEFSGLTAERTGNNLFDNSIKELLVNRRKDLFDWMNKREQMFAEGKGAEWSIGRDERKNVPNELISLIEGVNKLIPQYRKDLEEDNIDFEAMPTTQTDELNTVTRGGNIGVADVEGMGPAIIGSTRGGMPYLKAVAAFVNEGQGPKYIKKKNAFDYVRTVTEDIRKNMDQYTAIDEKNGIKTKRPFTIDELEPYLMSYFKAELDSPSVVRAYASPNNWDEDGMTADMFDRSVKEGKDPKEFVKKKFMEVAEDLLAPYFLTTETTTTARATPGGGRTGGTSGGRLTPTQQKEKQRQDSLLAEAARIIGVEGITPFVGEVKEPNYNLLLGRKGVGRVEKVGNELIIYGKRSGSSMMEDELKRIPLGDERTATEAVANFLSEDKTYNPRMGETFNAAEYIKTFNQRGK